LIHIVITCFAKILKNKYKQNKIEKNGKKSQEICIRFVVVSGTEAVARAGIFKPYQGSSPPVWE